MDADHKDEIEKIKGAKESCGEFDFADSCCAEGICDGWGDL